MSPLGHLTLLKESVWRTAGGLSPEASGCAWEGGTPEASACKSGGPGRPQGARGGGPGGFSVRVGVGEPGRPQRVHGGRCAGQPPAAHGLVCAVEFLTTFSSLLPVDAPGLDARPACLVCVAQGGILPREDWGPRWLWGRLCMGAPPRLSLMPPALSPPG